MNWQIPPSFDIADMRDIPAMSGRAAMQAESHDAESACATRVAIPQVEEAPGQGHTLLGYAFPEGASARQ